MDPPQAWGRPDLNELRKEYREYSQRSLDKCFSYLNFYVGLLAALLAATLTGLLQAQPGDPRALGSQTGWSATRRGASGPGQRARERRMPSRVTRMSHLTPAWYWFRQHRKSDVLQRQVDPPDMNGAWCTASRRSRPAAVRGLRGSGPACERSLGGLDGIIGQRHRRWMNELLVGYARVSTEQQDLTAQRNGLHALGVGDDRIYVDHGLTGTNRDRPGLRLALAACRAGDTLVVTKLDRLARSLPDARDILDELTTRNVKLSLGGSIHDSTDPVGRLLFNVLAMVAEFESDLIRMRTREGMKVARANGRLRGKQPKLKPNQAKHLLELHDLGTYTQAELAELFGVGRSTIYRTIDRMRPKPVEPERPFAHIGVPGSRQT